jgi:L-aspartate oxidase
MMSGVDALSGRPVIIGSGLAGLMTALRLAPEPVIVLTKGAIGTQCSSAWAQGGLAASIDDEDSPALHLADTLAAGDGLNDRDVALRITRAAPGAIDDLLRLGVRFDRAADGCLALGLEGAHSRRRIIHAAGDGTGRELMRAVVEVVQRTPSITVIEGLEARRLLVEDGAITGVLAAGGSAPAIFLTGRVVIATGGIGGLFRETTNPDGCFGQGLALAARAGAKLADLEFVQFHPTALAGTVRPTPLVSEAVRGEGALLVDENGERFLAGEPGAELAPRDVVARAIWRHLAEGHKVFLDARRKPGASFAQHFPAIAAACYAAGYDPARQLIPIRPAVHYHMGGIAVNVAGHSSVTGLWACGEAACTGFHGANRLASNSLIEAVVCAGWVAESIAGAPFGRAKRLRQTALGSAPDPSPVRKLLSHGIGVLRDETGLKWTISGLLPLACDPGATSDPALAGMMIAIAALQREESRGAHWRTDFPAHGATSRRRSLRLKEALAIAQEIAAKDAPSAPLAMRA